MKTSDLRQILLDGMVIPAHPLALDPDRRLDERHQRALSRYYLAAGAGGLAVGVHTTQFAIHDPTVGLYEPVLELAMEEMRRITDRPIMKVAGILGQTDQAVRESSLAREIGYDAGLLSVSAMKGKSEDELISHCRAVADVIPVFGFYLQPDVGGMALPYSFWRRFVEIENVVAIKIAAFNRYQTIDVIRALAESGREDIALYTGNDDNIVIDLLTTYRFDVNGQSRELRFSGGLLGHWAVWTKAAVDLFRRIQVEKHADGVSHEMLELANQVTDCNAVLFDVANHFRGCIPGLLEVLRQQGLVAERCCLDPEEVLSAGQDSEIDRIRAAYPHLTDDQFVAEHLSDWLQ